VGGEKGEHAEGVVLAEVDALREEVQALRAEMSEMHERVDFTERLLAQVKAKGQLGAGGE
jgi:cell division protein FtsB